MKFGSAIKLYHRRVDIYIFKSSKLAAGRIFYIINLQSFVGFREKLLWFNSTYVKDEVSHFWLKASFNLQHDQIYSPPHRPQLEPEAFCLQVVRLSLRWFMNLAGTDSILGVKSHCLMFICSSLREFLASGQHLIWFILPFREFVGYFWQYWLKKCE